VVVIHPPCKREFITNDFLQVVVCRSTERSAAYPLDARDIEGPLDVRLTEAYKFLEKNMIAYSQSANR
jgi:ATP-dependent DNA helicase RecG